MRVFSIATDIDKYQVILPVSYTDAVHDMIDFNGLPKIGIWEPLIFYIDNPLDKQSDFFSLTNSSAFACTKKAADKFMRFWEMSAELLPIFLEDGTELFIVNIIDCVNALDSKDTVYDYYEDGTRSNRILNYAFHKNRFHESSIFKIPETANIQILTYAGLKSPEDEFFFAYKESGLTGLIFYPLFNS